MMVHLINLFKQLKQTPTLVNFSLVQLSPSLFCILFILPVQWRDMVPGDNLTWEKPAQRQCATRDNMPRPGANMALRQYTPKKVCSGEKSAQAKPPKK